MLAGYRPVNISYNKIGPGYEQTIEYGAMVEAGGSGTGALGPNGEASQVVETIGGISGTFEMITSYEIVPIERHPRCDQLVNDYGGQYIDGLARWFNPTYVPATGARSALSGGAEGIPNPLFGVTSYKDVTMTFRHTYSVRAVPREIWDKAGKVVTNLPAGFPTPKGDLDKDGKEIKRRWMMQMPAVSRDGEGYRVVQEYVLLDKSGVADGLYVATNTPGNAQA